MTEIRKLKASEIDIKIKQSTEKGTLVLLYKTARVDMDILDETYGPENWQSDYKEIKGNLYAGIGIKSGNEWVWKWDCGIESRADDDGNQKKGEASDAFKRAGFKCGIGRELYTSPFIFIMSDILPVVKDSYGKTRLKNPYIKLKVKTIGYSKDGDINDLEIADDKGNVLWGLHAPRATKSNPESNALQHATLSELCTAALLSCETLPQLQAEVNKWAKTEDLELLKALAAEVKKIIVEKSKPTTEQIVGDSLPDNM